MNRNSIRSIFISLFLLISCFMNVGNSSFVINEESKKDGITIKDGSQAVCHIGDTKYTSIEKALDVAYQSASSQTITVYPNIEYTITESCTIRSGDTLLIPYSSSNSVTSLTGDVANNGFGDNNPSSFRKCLVKLANSLIIENGGRLLICGETGGTNPQGGTNGQYGELQFLDGGYIDCFGEIKCYGYIHDAQEKNRVYNDIAIYVHSTGKVSEPLAMYDWASAKNSANKMEYTFPINLFDLPNIRPPMYFEYKSTLTAYGHIYGSSFLVGHKKANGTIISYDNVEGFVQLQEGSGILLNFNSESDLISDSNYLKHKLYLYSTGNINISAVVVSLSGYELDTKKFYLPISGIYDLTVSSGTCVVNYNTKFLPGSNFKINSDANVEFKNNVTFYTSKTSDNGSVLPSYSFTSEAKFINNGTLIIDKGFDGKVYNIEDDSIVKTSSSYTNIQDCNESSGNGAIGPFIFGGGKINLADDELGTNAAFKTIDISSKYKSKNTYYYKLAEKVYSVSISPNSGSSKSNSIANYTLNAAISPADGVTNIEYHWSCTGGYFNNTEGTKECTGNNISYTTPANKNTDADIQYTVECYATYLSSENIAGSTQKTSATFTATKDNECFAKGTKILLSNGIYKNIEDLSYNDEIITWNFYTGKYESSKIAILVDHGEEIYNVLNLIFSDDYGISIIADHGLFDYDLNKFVYITIDNYKEYIGHKFVVYKNGENHTVTLLRGYIEEKLTNAYSITSAINYNVIANNMLTCPPPGDFYNFVKMGEKLRFDIDSFNKDVQTYGLYDYDVFEPYGITYETFIAFNGPYLKIPVEKGIFTFDYIIDLFNQYKSWI